MCVQVHVCTLVFTGWNGVCFMHVMGEYHCSWMHIYLNMFFGPGLYVGCSAMNQLPLWCRSSLIAKPV